MIEPSAEPSLQPGTGESDLELAGVLWDMDGTLIDSEPLWLLAEDAMLERFGLTMSDQIRRRLIGSGLWDAAELFRSLGVPLTADEIVEEWVAHVLAGLEDTGAAWRPGAREALAALREAGVPCALVTMSVRSLAEWVARGLPEGTFSAIIAGDEVEHAKPHPEPYLRGAQAIGAPIERCIAFEDSPNGLASALASGAISIGVPNLVDLEGAGAHALLPTLDGADAASLRALFRELRAAAPLVDDTLRPGDRVQLTGPKDRISTLTLVPGEEFHTHRGMIRHDDLIGLAEGSVVCNTGDEEYLILRPLLSDFVMSMPRGAAIVYPKDAAQILSLGDIFPGARVIEAGVGSGALSLHLLRAIGPDGELHSFERREEFADIARANIEAYAGPAVNWSLTVGELTESLAITCAPASVDRAVLDMLAPWECVDAVADALKPGGVLTCYVATVTQLSRTVEEMRSSGRFTHPKSSETMVRGWHVEGLAVRPDHRMVGHTGFLVTARKLAPGTRLPERKRRASKSDYSQEDLEAWTPETIGERTKSDRILRKKARQARQIAEDRQS